jgi:hypothetical protein
MRIRIAAALFLFTTPLVLAQDTAPRNPQTTSQVILALPDYERLRGPEPESFTVVDTAWLAGTFEGRNLTVTFAGRSVGRRVATSVLSVASGIGVWGCKGQAVISRNDDSFRLTPLADSFTTTCQIAAAGSDRLELVATRDVLAIVSSVVDGELVAGERAADGTSRYSLVRQSGGSGETVAPTATGHYLITLLPDENRFRYAIDVHNPNRHRQTLEVRFRSGEHLQQVDAVAPYEVVAGAYRFDLQPGDTTLVLKGQLPGDSFVPPVEASLQYLAIESHPIVRARIAGAVKRVSAAETGAPIQFRGPQAFLLARGETVRWTKSRLEALHTVSYAVSGARHTFFIPAEGAVLGETFVAVDNQGASDVKLPLRPEPTYVSIENEPIVMTKDTDGKLTVPLSAGTQTLLVQHRQGIRHLGGFGFGSLVIPQLPVPATSLLVTINYPRQWYPLVQSFSTRTKFWRPSAVMMFVFLGLLLWTERVLSWLGLPPRQRLAIAAACAAASTSFDTFALVLILADALLSTAWLARQFRKEKWTFLKGLAAATVVAAGILMFGYSLQTRTQLERLLSPGGGIASVSPTPSLVGEAREFSEESSRQPFAFMVATKIAESKQELNYQGLPARFEIPGGERHTYFGQEMLPTDQEHSVRVLLLSSTIVWFLGMAFVALALATIWRSRAALIAGLRERLAGEGVGVEAVGA